MRALLLVCFLLFSASASALDTLPDSIAGISLQQSRPQIFLFVSANCPCSQSHEEPLVKLTKEFPEYTFRFIHANQDEDFAQTKLHFAEKTIAIEQDKGAQLADLLAAYKTPHAYIVNAEGKILYNGGVSESAVFKPADNFPLRQALLDLRAGKLNQLRKIRTLGCIIKREK